MPQSDDRAPLLDDGGSPKSTRTVIPKIYIFVSALSVAYAFTGVTMLYAVRQMTCEEYYKTHEPNPKEGDICSIGEIEGSAATAISNLGLVTTVFAVVNLLYAKWSIERSGFKWALVQQAAWPLIRLVIQIVAVKKSGYWGVVIMSASQAVSGLGGPQGYQLVANSFASSLAGPGEETAVFGTLQGCVMIGTALGFVLGGWSGDHLGMLAPFEISLGLTVLSLLFALIVVPSVQQDANRSTEVQTTRKSGVLSPLKVFLPRGDGGGKYYGLTVMGVGIFVGVLATGFNPILLQIYGTNAFAFTPSKNGYMMAANSLIRGGFLTFAFAHLIRLGRTWYAASPRKLPLARTISRSTDIVNYDTHAQVAGVPEEPTQVLEQQPGAEFDLLYLRISMLLDSLLTGAVALVTEGWQLLGLACLMPIAAGSAPASKGIITEMCEPEERVDALSAMAILETTGILITTTVTGNLFAALAAKGLSRYTFALQCLVGLMAILIMSCARFPSSRK